MKNLGVEQSLVQIGKIEYAILLQFSILNRYMRLVCHARVHVWDCGTRVRTGTCVYPSIGRVLHVYVHVNSSPRVHCTRVLECRYGQSILCVPGRPGSDRSQSCKAAS